MAGLVLIQKIITYTFYSYFIRLYYVHTTTIIILGHWESEFLILKIYIHHIILN